MNILLDESLPRTIVRLFVNHSVSTVVEKGWSGKKNGELLRLAQGEFDMFITADQNLQYQQNLKGYEIAIVVLVAKANRLELLKPAVSKLLKVINEVESGEVRRIT